MQLVIQSGFVLATHTDEQVIAGLYPGCEIISYQGHFALPGPLQPPAPDPRTDEEKTKVYRDRRRLAYPSLADQLDMLYWDKVNGTTSWQQAVATVKAQYPKA